MGKRSNGEGSIYKRSDGRWCGSCYKCVEGKERRAYVYGKTQKEVKVKLLAIQKEKTVETVCCRDLSLVEWMMQWLNKYKKLRVKETTYENYRIMIQTHIAGSDIGRIKLKELQTEDLQFFYDSKTKEITKMGTTLSVRMVKYIATLVNGSLEQAVKDKLIFNNPNKGVILPKKQKKEIQPLSENEVKILLKAVENTELFMPILLEIYTGLRKGELLGLNWSDVDFYNGNLHIRNSLARVPVEQDAMKKSELRLTTPKTYKSNRIIPLTSKVLEELKKHRQKQDEFRKEYADIWMDRNLVFCKQNGDFLDPRDFLAHFQKALEQAGIRKCRFHDLRHTFASMLLNQGEELKVIQELLGHTTITTTADIYAHLKVEKKFEAVAKIDEALR